MLEQFCFFVFLVFWFFGFLVLCFFAYIYIYENLRPLGKTLFPEPSRTLDLETSCTPPKPQGLLFGEAEASQVRLQQGAKASGVGRKAGIWQFLWV